MASRWTGWVGMASVLGALAGGCGNDGGGVDPDPADTEEDAALESDASSHGSPGGDGTPDASVSSPPPPDAGGSAADAVTRRIAAEEGGTIVSADGVFSLIVPPAALEEDTEFSIRVVPREEWPDGVAAEAPVSELYDVKPDGLRFRVPAVARFEWDDAPRELSPSEGEFAFLGEIHSRSEDGEIELSASQTVFYTGEGDGLVIAGEVEHLSGKWVGTNRGCRVTVEAPVGEYFVRDAFSSSRFDLFCSDTAASSIEAVAPLASSSATSVVGVSFAGSQEGDSVLIVSPGLVNYWRPGASTSAGPSFPMALDAPTWTCLAAGTANVAAGVALTRAGGTVAVIGNLGPVTCNACELTEQDCSATEELNVSTCACDCLLDDHQDCPEHKVFVAETCECRCIADESDCEDNQAFNEETCACDCALTDALCGAGKHVEPETCTCACNQLQNCSGAFPTFSHETCSCECQVNPNDCEANKVFDDSSCSCRCPAAIDGNASCPSELQYYDDATCACACWEEDQPGAHAEYCAQFNKRYDAQACACVCDLDPNECTGNLAFDETSCQCYCQYGDVRNCDQGYVFDEAACACACDMDVPCDLPDFARNPETCECECILDEQASCRSDQVLNTELCECECAQVLECGSLQVWDPESCQCVCAQTLICDEPQVFNPDTCACGCPTQCGQNQVQDPQSCECECDPQLPTCPTGQSRDPDTCECEPNCGNGLDDASEQCDNSIPGLPRGGCNVNQSCTGGCQCQCTRTTCAAHGLPTHVNFNCGCTTGCPG